MAKDDSNHGASHDVEDVELDEEVIADLDTHRDTDPRGGFSSQCMSGAQME